MKSAVVGQPGAEKFGRVMGLQVGRTVADVGVGGGVPLVEAVTGEGRHLLPQRRRLLRRKAWAAGRLALAAMHKSQPQGGHFPRLKFTHALAQAVGLRPGQSGDFRRHAQHLLLKQQHALRGSQNRFQRRMQVTDLFLAPVAAHKGLGHAAGRRAGFEEGIGDGQVPHGPRLKLAQGALRSG